MGIALAQTHKFSCLLHALVFHFQPPPLPVSPPPPDTEDDDDEDDEGAASPTDYGDDRNRGDEEIMFDNDVVVTESSPPRFDVDQYGSPLSDGDATNEVVTPELDPQVLFIRLKEVRNLNMFKKSRK